MVKVVLSRKTEPRDGVKSQNSVIFLSQDAFPTKFIHSTYLLCARHFQCGLKISNKLKIIIIALKKNYVTMFYKCISSLSSDWVYRLEGPTILSLFNLLLLS